MFSGNVHAILGINVAVNLIKFEIDVAVSKFKRTHARNARNLPGELLEGSS